MWQVIRAVRPFRPALLHSHSRQMGADARVVQLLVRRALHLDRPQPDQAEEPALGAHHVPGVGGRGRRRRDPGRPDPRLTASIRIGVRVVAPGRGRGAPPTADPRRTRCGAPALGHPARSVRPRLRGLALTRTSVRTRWSTPSPPWVQPSTTSSRWSQVKARMRKPCALEPAAWGSPPGPAPRLPGRAERAVGGGRIGAPQRDRGLRAGGRRSDAVRRSRAVHAGRGGPEGHAGCDRGRVRRRGPRGAGPKGPADDRAARRRVGRWPLERSTTHGIASRRRRWRIDEETYLRALEP